MGFYTKTDNRKNAKKGREYVYVGAIDIQKAFDSVNREEVMEIT